ncbi:MAG TPA: hypothetical protein VHI93_06655 [Candidatus Thermoplasmatota archaeon]|nr:hypothetical protein [Candidatus Thermoplasmatota archaeon]
MGPPVGKTRRFGAGVGSLHLPAVAERIPHAAQAASKRLTLLNVGAGFLLPLFIGPTDRKVAIVALVAIVLLALATPFAKSLAPVVAAKLAKKWKVKPPQAIPAPKPSYSRKERQNLVVDSGNQPCEMCGHQAQPLEDLHSGKRG